MKYWNRLIRLRDSTENADFKKKCEKLLSSYNTASGGRIDNEIEIFLTENENK